MLPSTNIILESLLETQLKFKILQSVKHLPEKEEYRSLNFNCGLKRLFLKLIYTITFKKVLSSKRNNRIVINYFRKFSDKTICNTEKNKNLIELEYVHTLAINNVYEVSIITNHD